MRVFFRLLMFIIGALLGQTFNTGGDGGTGGSGGDGGQQGNQQGQQGQGQQQQGQQGQQGNQQGQQGQEQRFTQADLDRARKEEQDKLTAKQESDRRKAEEAALVEQNKFKELADQRGVEVEQLRGKAALADTYGERLNSWVEAEIKEWPAEVKKLDPGKDKLAERLTWVENSRDLAAKLKALPPVPDSEAGKRNGAGSNNSSGSGDNTNSGGSGGDNNNNGNQQRQQYRFTSPGDVAW